MRISTGGGGKRAWDISKKKWDERKEWVTTGWSRSPGGSLGGGKSDNLTTVNSRGERRNGNLRPFVTGGEEWSKGFRVKEEKKTSAQEKRIRTVNDKFTITSGCRERNHRPQAWWSRMARIQGISGGRLGGEEGVRHRHSWGWRGLQQIRIGEGKKGNHREFLLHSHRRRGKTRGGSRATIMCSGPRLAGDKSKMKIILGLRKLKRRRFAKGVRKVRVEGEGGTPNNPIRNKGIGGDRISERC